jgi:hypothetical protein
MYFQIFRRLLVYYVKLFVNTGILILLKTISNLNTCTWSPPPNGNSTLHKTELLRQSYTGCYGNRCYGAVFSATYVFSKLVAIAVTLIFLFPLRYACLGSKQFYIVGEKSPVHPHNTHLRLNLSLHSTAQHSTAVQCKMAVWQQCTR